MKIVVTGSEGFIGTRLCEVLREQGHQVVGIDRKSGHEVREELGGILRAGDVKVVYHLAAQTSVFNDARQQIIDDNITTFAKVCDLCAIYGCKLVYASSSTANESNTTSLYGLSKSFDERYAAMYNKKATGVRLHNVYGRNQRIGTLLWHLMTNNITPLYNEGNNVRCFTYIDDIVEGLIYASKSEEVLLNCVNKEPITTKEFADEALKRINAGIAHPRRVTLVKDIRPLDNKCQEVNDTIPTIPFEYTSYKDGLKKIFDERKAKDDNED